MQATTAGIHHITAIATDPQANLEFYSDLLGLRMVKKTVNFDDPGTYHLYYGDELGRPGTIVTFFPWPQARRGSRGSGQATSVAFSVPEGSLGWWQERLAARGAVIGDRSERFDEELVSVLDPDGLRLELVSHAGARAGSPRADGPVPERYAIRGFHSTTLTVEAAAATAELLSSELGLRPVAESGSRSRFAAGATGEPGTLVDLLASPGIGPGRIAAGTVHHVAWRAEDDGQQEAWRSRLSRRGLQVTPVLDRNYFRSIYFREPGGVLFEIATDSPGFTTDEPASSLGSELRLPSWLEPHRDRIEEALPPLRTARHAESPS